ncbi:MAG: hypothetical protein JXQ27_07715 [Acidobacteria bacterium]|nr:hypothetical protein [Acidobacteriota bacterium]
MSLREILEKLATQPQPVILYDSRQGWPPAELLADLSDRVLNRQAHLQPGMYIAEINDAGYLGRILYRFKSQA